MLVVASANGRVGIREAMRVLREGGSALDAVETGCRLVESNPDDHSVGYSGIPNLLGVVELDASIMDGKTLAAGAVGAVKNFEHPISIARKVMEELPHVFLVGEGAERFAREAGFEEKDLLTPEAEEIRRRLLEGKGLGIYAERLKYLERIREFANLATDPERALGTVNFIARDREGNLAVGVSTSGWACKYPGRLGDSPVIGAGNYADNRYGAAACTGRGEMAIRKCTAYSAVMYMRMGASVEEAGRRAMEDLKDLVDPYAGAMSLICVDAQGNHAAFSNREGSRYVFMTDEMDEPEERPRILVT